LDIDSKNKNALNKFIILYGAGIIGQQVARIFNRFYICVECFCDVDSKKQGKIYAGLVVKSIDEIKNEYKHGDYELILTVDEIKARQIKAQLINNEIFKESDFSCQSYDIYLFNMINESFKPTQQNFENANNALMNVSSNFSSINHAQEIELKDFLLKHYFSGKDILSTDSGINEFNDHFFNRLKMFRTQVIPWLNCTHQLKDAKILEIGCGTGSTTIALCEQGANVYAIDVNSNSMLIARKRADLYSLKPKFYELNAMSIKDTFTDNFDFIIFSASIEHMTYQERILSIKAAFEMIGENQYIVLTDIPNRLWHTDTHTSLEPFYNWLPDALAIDYAQFTKRDYFNKCFCEKDFDYSIQLSRWGRGVSYHEFEIALGQETWEVVSSMNEFWGVPYDLFSLLLIMNGPVQISSGFYRKYLNLILRKSTRRSRHK